MTVKKPETIRVFLAPEDLASRIPQTDEGRAIAQERLSLYRRMRIELEGNPREFTILQDPRPTKTVFVEGTPSREPVEWVFSVTALPDGEDSRVLRLKVFAELVDAPLLVKQQHVEVHVGSALLKAAVGAVWPFISAILLLLVGAWIKHRFDLAKSKASPAEEPLVIAPTPQRKRSSWMRWKREEKQH